MKICNKLFNVTHNPEKRPLPLENSETNIYLSFKETLMKQKFFWCQVFGNV